MPKWKLRKLECILKYSVDFNGMSFNEQVKSSLATFSLKMEADLQVFML
jgi:hypothetical protein